jgi:hypothetical protein
MRNGKVGVIYWLKKPIVIGAAELYQNYIFSNIGHRMVDFDIGNVIHLPSYLCHYVSCSSAAICVNIFLCVQECSMSNFRCKKINFLPYFLFFDKYKSRIVFCVSVYPPLLTSECLHQFSWNLVCIYNGTSVHINGIFHKFRGRVVVKALCYKPEGRGFDIQWIYSIFQMLSAALGPGFYSASNRNEYQKQKNNVLGSR